MKSTLTSIIVCLTLFGSLKSKSKTVFVFFKLQNFLKTISILNKGIESNAKSLVQGRQFLYNNNNGNSISGQSPDGSFQFFNYNSPDGAININNVNGIRNDDGDFTITNNNFNGGGGSSTIITNNNGGTSITNNNGVSSLFNFGNWFRNGFRVNTNNFNQNRISGDFGTISNNNFNRSPNGGVITNNNFGK